ncbi:hypothetical protein [Solilutibacter pythonis]|uniref:hypothetical protein n=1 Tax=Solilutibacter pythonis TaxID=2483112 RepID=UPI001314C6CE|nr:hypothetical protein [Lysobacter pythonis]
MTDALQTVITHRKADLVAIDCLPVASMVSTHPADKRLDLACPPLRAIDVLRHTA